jgi:hypothetical protein
MNNPHDVRAAASAFQIDGELVSAALYGSGHINDTYCAVFNQRSKATQFVFQRINHGEHPESYGPFGCADGR